MDLESVTSNVNLEPGRKGELPGQTCARQVVRAPALSVDPHPLLRQGVSRRGSPSKRSLCERSPVALADLNDQG